METIRIKKVIKEANDITYVNDYNNNFIAVKTPMMLMQNQTYYGKLKKKGDKLLFTNVYPEDELYNVHFFQILFGGYKKREVFERYPEDFQNYNSLYKILELNKIEFESNTDIAGDLFLYLSIIDKYKDQLKHQLFDIAYHFKYFINKIDEGIKIRYEFNSLEYDKQLILDDIFNTVFINIYRFTELNKINEFNKFESDIKKSAFVYDVLHEKRQAQVGYLSLTGLMQALKNNDYDVNELIITAIKNQIVYKFKLEGDNTWYFQLLDVAKKEHFINGYIKQSYVNRSKYLKPTLDEDVIEKFSTFSHGEEQMEAIKKITAAPVGIDVLVGSAGTGKTATTQTITKVMKARYNWTNRDIVALAPIGKAAKVLSESLGMPASTIHRALLRKELKGPKLIIIDECGMLDLDLFYETLQNVSMTTKIIMLGDTEQLTSVGFGAILRDIETRTQTPVSKLTQVFRNEGTILKLAEESIGRTHHDEHDFDKNFFSGDDTIRIEASLDNILKMLEDDGVNYYKNLNYQIITPVNDNENAEFSVKAINEKIQARRIELLGLTENYFNFYLGDRIIITKNQANKQLLNEDRGRAKEKGIYNGDMGTVINVNTRSIEVMLDSGNIVVLNSFDNSIYSVDLSYAITVHKSQGSGWDNVMFLIDPRVGKIMLNKNLVYTAITRSKKGFVTNLTAAEFYNASNKSALDNIHTTLFLNKRKK